MTIAEIKQKINEHTDELLDWAEGRRSFTNYGPNPPYTPDVIARMDAAEVEKHAHAIEGLKSALSAERAFSGRSEGQRPARS